MNVTISVCGSFPAAYHYGRYLEERGRLTRLLNPLPYSRTKRFGVSKEKTRSLWVFGGAHYLNNLYAPPRLNSWNQYALDVAFDNAVARQLGSPDIVNVWAANGLATIRRAHRLGLKAVLHTGSTHIVWQTETLREEFRRLRFDGALTRPALVRRTVAEYEEADAIVVSSRFALRTFVQAGVPECKLFCVHEAARPVTSKPRDRRDAMPRILFVGNCSIRKGIPYLLQAFRQLRTRATLRLVGPIDQRLLDLIGGLPEGAEAVGPRRGDALAAEYSDADVFCLPSVEDGWGLVVSEAMSAGLPVVVSDQAGAAEQVEDGVNGFVVPARDSAALAAKLEELVADRDLRERIGAAAVAAVSGRDWRAYGEELDEQVFLPLYKGRGGGR